MDIWKGRCRERACIVIDKLVGRKMERISKHFFAFILNYFSFFLWQVCDGVKDGEFPLRKASFWFFHEIKCSAFWGVGNLSQNLNLVNLKICRRCPKKIIPKISWRQEEMYYCTTIQKQCVEQFWLFLGHFEAIASEIAAFQCLESQTGRLPPWFKMEAPSLYHCCTIMF